MGQETENIEAKLAAYVDGQLSAAERQEIENYLASNPEHRALIADLMTTRDSLRSLPKESAPPELAEMLNSQLERSALLDGSEMPRPILRISRFPQLAALAAILLLTVGLGIVLYFVLFPAKPVSFSIAPTKAPATMEAPLAVAEREVVSSPALGKSAGSVVAAADNVEKKAEESVATTQPATTDNSALVLVVSTDNPQQTQNQVADYFKSNGIVAQPVTEPMPEPLKFAQSQVLEPSRYNPVQQKELVAAREVGAANTTTSTENRSFAYSSPPPATQQAAGQAQAPVQQLQQATGQAESANGYIVRGVTRRQADSLALSLNSRKGQLAYFSNEDAKQLSPPIASNASVNVEAQVLADQNKGRQEAQSSNSLAQAIGNEKDSVVDQEKQHSFAGKVAAGGNVTLDSTTQPATAPSQQQAAPNEEPVTLGAAPAPAAVAATAPSTIAKNDTLMVSINDLTAVGSESVFRATVADDGTVNLPQIGKVTAAGLTLGQCEQAIALKCKEDNLIANANVNVHKLQDVPATGRALGSNGQVPVMKAAAMPRDEKLELLILLKNQQPQEPAKSAAPIQSVPASAPAGKS